MILAYLYTGNTQIIDWFEKNALIQTFLFLFTAFIPSWLTGHMFYVDIAWPLGVMMIGAQLVYSCLSPENFEMESFDARSVLTVVFEQFKKSSSDKSNLHALLMGIALTLHGGRMGFGALALFAPYVRSKDLPRYEYAKLRFYHHMGGASNKFWILKRNHDIFQQYFANVVILGTIGALIVSTKNTRESFEVLQFPIVSWMGLTIWVLAWIIESAVDIQKLIFQIRIKLRKKNSTNVKFVLGYAPYNGKEFFLWTLSRHPNYFCEWLSWCGLVISTLPCLYDLYTIQGESMFLVGYWALNLFLIPRFVYDCLMYWTGAAPAEHFSHQKRGERYSNYQNSTRVFFPFPIPFVNHAMKSGWSTIYSKEN